MNRAILLSRLITNSTSVWKSENLKVLCKMFSVFSIINLFSIYSYILNMYIQSSEKQ